MLWSTQPTAIGSTRNNLICSFFSGLPSPPSNKKVAHTQHESSAARQLQRVLQTSLWKSQSRVWFLQFLRVDCLESTKATKATAGCLRYFCRQLSTMVAYELVWKERKKRKRSGEKNPEGLCRFGPATSRQGSKLAAMSHPDIGKERARRRVQ